MIKHELRRARRGPVAFAALFAAALFAATLGACRDATDPDTPSADRPIEETAGALSQLGQTEIDIAVADTLRGLTRPPRTKTSDVQYAWEDRRRELLRNMHDADPALGQALLASLSELPYKTEIDRYALLAAGTYAAPETAAPMLATAVLEYEGGPLKLDLGERGQAAVLLAEIQPERAIEILEPLLSNVARGKTLPRREMLLNAWLAACKATGYPREEVLILVATDIRQEAITRHLAVSELGKLKGPRISQALMEVFTESTGNGILRRKAAQAIVASEDTESAILSITSVLEREADSNMQVFLSRTLDNLEAAR